jgi:TolB-like protein
MTNLPGTCLRATEVELTPDLIAGQMKRIVESRAFSRAGFLRKFLQCCVEETLHGNSGVLKEVWLGPSVFGRNERFNPEKNPIVRVQAGRLRAKLALFYASEGQVDSIRIAFPKGSYVPVFSAGAQTGRNSHVGGLKVAVIVRALTNLDGSAETERYADRMTAELTSVLMNSEGVEVLTRDSAGLHRVPDYIFEGTVQTAESHDRITLTMTDAATGHYVWTALFEQRHNRLEPDFRKIAEFLRDELLNAPFALMPQPTANAGQHLN